MTWVTDRRYCLRSRFDRERPANSERLASPGYRFSSVHQDRSCGILQDIGSILRTLRATSCEDGTDRQPPVLFPGGHPEMARRAKGWKLLRDPRTAIFFVRFTHAGRRFKLSTGERDSGPAAGQAARVYADVVSGRWAPGRTAAPGSTRAFDEVAAEWLADIESTVSTDTFKLYEDIYVGAHFAPFFKTIDRLTTVGVEDYKAAPAPRRNPRNAEEGAAGAPALREVGGPTRTLASDARDRDAEPARRRDAIDEEPEADLSDLHRRRGQRNHRQVTGDGARPARTHSVPCSRAVCCRVGNGVATSDDRSAPGARRLPSGQCGPPHSRRGGQESFRPRGAAQ